jgi:hypothetical protein
MSGSDDLIPARTDVLVTAVEGTTLIVWPVDGHAVLPLPLTLSDDTASIDPAAGAGSTTSTAPDVAEQARRDTPGPIGSETSPAPDHPEGEQP